MRRERPSSSSSEEPNWGVPGTGVTVCTDDGGKTSRLAWVRLSGEREAGSKGLFPAKAAEVPVAVWENECVVGDGRISSIY